MLPAPVGVIGMPLPEDTLRDHSKENGEASPTPSQFADAKLPNGKLPYQYLSETCQKRKIDMNNELVSVVTTYTVRLTVGETTITSGASTRQRARENAALLMLERLGISTSLEKTSHLETARSSSVSALNEHSLVHKYEKPGYTFTADGDVQRDTTNFTCVCTFENRTAHGTGKSKKLSKREAALAMLNLLNKPPS